MLSNRISNNHTIWCRKSSYRNKIVMHYMKSKSLISNYYYWKRLKNIVSIKITLTCFGNKYFLIIFADKRLWVLNISVGKICKFLWCIETDLFKKWKKKQVLLLTCEVYSYKHTYLHSYKNKGLEQRHRIVTTIQSNGHYTISLVRINHCTWH